MSHEDIARSFLMDLSQGRWASAASRFDARMDRAMPVDRLEALWRSILGAHGDWVAVERVSEKPVHTNTVVAADVRFARGRLRLRVTVAPDGRIAGLFYGPVPEDAAGEWKPPDYVKVDAFTEHEVRVGSPTSLPGVVTIPLGTESVPGVVLVHGSGPNDRDETVGPTKIFRDLAMGLATRGIAAIRYDKRTLVDPRPLSTEKEEVLDDALAAARELRKTPGIDPARIVIVGHSQGGALAPRIAELDTAVAGIVTLAAPARPLEVAMLSQLEYLLARNPGDSTLAGLLEEAKRFQARVEARDLRPDERVAVPGGGSVPGAYFLAARDYHPERVAASLACPVLVLQGGRDYQVTERDDFALWRKALAGDARATLRVYPEVDHRFVAGEGPSSPEQYLAGGHVDARVVADIASWVLGLPTRAP